MADTLQITMPQMGESVSEGTVLTWYKQEGDWVDKDETIVEVSTDKVDAEVPAPAAGKIAKILAQEDETVAVGQPLAELEVDEAGAAAAREERAAAEPAAAAAPAGDGAAAAPAGAAPATAAVPEGARVSPVARRAAAAHGIDLAGVSGTGTGGRIVKDDVLSQVNGQSADGRDGAAGTLAPPTEPPAEQPMRGADATLARYMSESLSIPTATSFRTISVATLDARRRQLNQALKDAGKDMKVSFTHLIGYALAVAWKEHPSMGHSFREADGKPVRVAPSHINLGLAVDVQRKDGTRTLIVPVIKGADVSDFAAFREVYEDLIAKTRDGSLSPDDMQGANMTLTNPGGIGTVASVPRLMPGQGSIIATGAISYPPGLTSVDSARLAELGVSKVMTMTSTYDHRVIQGAESGAFLRTVEGLLQGDNGFFESVFESLGLGTPGEPPAVGRGAGGRSVGRGVDRDAGSCPGGHLADQGAPDARPPRGPPRPARVGADRGPGARALHCRADRADHAPDPGAHPADRGAGREPGRGPPPPARHLLRHDRLRDRAHLGPPQAGLAAPAHRVRALPDTALAGGEEADPRPADGRRGARGLHPPLIPGREELLDRGRRHAHPDARRDPFPGGRVRRPGGLPRDGSPRTAERARARRRSVPTPRSWPSSRARRTSTS